MSDLPASLVAACTSGDLPRAKSIYNDFVQANPTSKSSVLYEMGVLGARNGQADILSFCFSQGLVLDPESVNDSLLYGACDSGSIAIFRILLDNGMDVNKYLELGGDPLTSACCAGNVELATFLLDEGANPNSDYPCGSYTALIWAIVGDRGSLDLVRLLLAGGAVVKETGALVAAAEHGNLEALKLLVTKEDADLEEVEEYGNWNGRKQDDAGTALYKAAAEGHADIVAFLLEKGANAGFKDGKGRSVAEVAEERGHEAIVKMLREAGTPGNLSSSAAS